MHVCLLIRVINNPTYGWKALRLLARKSPHFFGPIPSGSTQMYKKVPQYLELIVGKMAKDMPVCSWQSCIPVVIIGFCKCRINNITKCLFILKPETLLDVECHGCFNIASVFEICFDECCVFNLCINTYNNNTTTNNHTLTL